MNYIQQIVLYVSLITVKMCLTTIFLIIYATLAITMNF